jgi:tetratricopeptide (TPR) repeat protein
MSDTKLPQRPEQHIKGDRAVNVFRYKLNPSWATNTSESDYGWDILVTIVEDGQVKDDFFVQLKGHEKPNYSKDKSFVSEQISVETINFLLRKTVPTMLCVCDTSNDTLFYVWIHEDIRRIKSEHDDWEKRESVTFRLPTENILDTSEEGSAKITRYVKDFYRKIANEQEIVEVLSPSLGIEEGILSKSSKDESLQVIRPALEKAGLIDDFAEDIQALSLEDQELLRKIKEISFLLNKYLHSHAKKELDVLSEQVEVAMGSVKGKYYNSYGVYYSHIGDLELALDAFSKATEASPDNYRAITNKVQTEYELANKNKIVANPSEWFRKLDEVIERQPDYYSAARTKAYIIAAVEGGAKAETYLRGTKSWDAEPMEAKVCLAEIYVHEEKITDAQRVLGDDESTDNFAYWSLKGFVLFSLSIGLINRSKEYYLTGMGPSAVNPNLLLMSEKAYQRAYEIFLGFGLPIFSADTIVNYTTVLHLQFKHEASLDICKQFLSRHPDNQAVNGAIASCYLGLGKPDKAVPYAQAAFKMNPNSTTLKNLCICIYAAEEYEECIKTVKSHIESPIAVNEKGVLLSLLAISLNEIGNGPDSQNVLRAMQKVDQFVGESISTEAVICRMNGCDREMALDIYKKGKKQYPDNIILLSNYAASLNPTVKEEAEELRECFNTLAAARALFPDEYGLYARALVTLKDTTLLLKVINQAKMRFPADMNLKYELAISLGETGEDEAAYEMLQECFSLFQSSYAQIRNFAVISYKTERLEEAIKLLQKALIKAPTPETKGELHCLLFELKRKLGYAGKDVLRHVHEFGKTVKSDDSHLEARYLSMFMMATLTVGPDDETKEWFDIARERLSIFSEKNPDNPYFKSFKFDTSIPEEEKGKEMLATIMSQILPQIIKSAQVRMAARNMPYPLAFKSTHIGTSSLFVYWYDSIHSNEESDYLHILNAQNNRTEENEVAKNATSVVIDISALLTLTQLDLLAVLDEFDFVILSSGTRYIIELELSGIHPPHPLAEKLEKWRLSNKHKIRVRAVHSDPEDLSTADSYELSDIGIYVRRNQGIENIIGAGMGESILLARQLNLPLYSDDSTMRYLASEEYHVRTFSFLSLLYRCELNGSINEEAVSELYARLIENHYLAIPFSSKHLSCALKMFLKSHEGDRLKSEDLVNDKVLGVFLKEFGNTKNVYTGLSNIACEWWLSLMASTDISDSIVQECMKYISFVISMRIMSSLLRGIAGDEKERWLAGLWFRLVVIAQRNNRELLPKVWSHIKQTTQYHYSEDERKYNKVIYELIPSLLVKFLSQDGSLSNADKVTILYEITSMLPNSSADSDRRKIETYILKLKPPFFV